MATDFPYVPSYTSTSEVTPSVRVVRFGDGYVQRAANGINIFPDKWSLTFQNLTDADALAIETTLKTAAGGTLQWKPSPALEADPYRYWMCPKWSRTRNNYNSQTLQCDFEEVFE